MFKNNKQIMKQEEGVEIRALREGVSEDVRLHVFSTDLGGRCKIKYKITVERLIR